MIGFCGVPERPFPGVGPGTSVWPLEWKEINLYGLFLCAHFEIETEIRV